MDEPLGAGTPLGANGLVIYWRPGCFYCSDLFRQLDQAGIDAECRNIWEDEEARRFVQEHNRGNETVPTVAWQDTVLTNPPPASLIETLRRAGGTPPLL
jgi:mycoredoxin